MIRTHCKRGHLLPEKPNYKNRRICRLCGKETDRRRRQENPERERARGAAVQRRYRAKSKSETIAHYGGKCACCGEDNPKFLTLDHINNDGGAHRKKYGAGSMYSWLRMYGFSDKLQLMCFNCNCGRNLNGGICPHKDARR